MTTKDHDTDPSTPSARRPTKNHSSNSPPPPAVDTDPGLAPPPFPTPAPAAPLGIRVPPPSVRPPAPRPAAVDASSHGPSLAKKDSVELLLDGMAELRLDRPRTTPQTDGEASASYHAEHAVRPADRPPIEDERKVLFDRPSAPITLRLARGPAPELGFGEQPPETTVVTPPRTLRRVLLALLAGILVVLAIFFLLQMAAQRTASGPPAAVSVGAASPRLPPTSEPLPALSAAPPSVSVESLPAAAAAPSVAASIPELDERAAPAQTNRRRSRYGASPSSSDFGEFKTTY